MSEEARRNGGEVLDFGFHNCRSPGISARLKTNYFDLAEAERQAEILRRTVRCFD